MITLPELKVEAKDFGKAAMNTGSIVLAIAGGAIASQKFLDFTEIAKKMNVEVDPEKFVFKHQGGIKAAAVVLGLAAFRKKKIHPILKWSLIGVALQGAVQEGRNWKKDDGKPYIDQIGNNGMDNEMMNAAQQIVNAANEYPTQVGAGADYMQEVRPDVSLMNNSMTTVAGPDPWNFSNSPF